MYLRRRIRSKLIWVAIIIFLFIYWRGVKAVTEEKSWNCRYHVIYAVCDAKNNKAKLPTFWEIIKAGVRF